MKKIKLFADGLKFDEIKENFGINVDGYTFNPSIFKNHGVKDYISHSKKILSLCESKPVSLEVFADEEKEMLIQAEKLHQLGKNVFVKIPITFTNKTYTTKVLKQLVEKKIKINLTAIFTLEQINEVLPILKNTESILSVFAGRIYDSGLNASKIMMEICKEVRSKSSCQVLWASPRMSYDYLTSIEVGCHIITMQGQQIKKLKLFGKKLEDYSLETVKQFYNDAHSSGFKI